MQEFVTTFITLFLIMDPFGNCPIFIALLKDIPTRRRLFVIVRELLLAYGLLNLFLFFGDAILTTLNLRQDSVRLTGGIILFLIAIKMLFAEQKNDVSYINGGKEPVLVPLAVPLIAGPAILATLILMRGSSSLELPWLFLAMSVAWVASSVFLLASQLMERFLRPAGIHALEKLMSMILLSLAIQNILDAIVFRLESVFR